LPAEGNGTPLKKRLRRAERRRNLLFGALILPLALVVLVAFIWPIGSLLTIGVENPEIHDNLPRTLAALEDWGGSAPPAEAAFRALADELAAAKGSPAIAAIAKRLNRENAGYRSLVMKTARKLPLDAAVPAREALIAIDAQWGELATWQAIHRAGGAFTPFYLLAAIDRAIDADGNIATAPEDERIYVDVLLRTFWMSLIVTVCCLVLGFPLAYLMATQSGTPSANVLMIFVLLPFWTSILVRVAAWLVLLQTEGLVNQAADARRRADRQPDAARLQQHRGLYRDGAYPAALHDPAAYTQCHERHLAGLCTRRACRSAARRSSSFWKVYFPQALPGVGAGCLLVFINVHGLLHHPRTAR
jgi:putative spermidine/putrescine transport system permease protein